MLVSFVSSAAVFTLPSKDVGSLCTFPVTTEFSKDVTLVKSLSVMELCELSCEIEPCISTIFAVEVTV